MDAQDRDLVEEVLLLETHRDLVRRDEYERAEKVMDLLAAAVAVEELVAAVERGDGPAMAFHADLALRSLDARHPPGAHIIE